MAELSSEDVRFLSRTFGLEPLPDEIEEITLRLNALFRAMEPVERLDVSGAEAIPVLADEAR
jgi:hypothetical protein